MQKPNIVFILTDQQRIDTIRANGHAHMDTPNLDRLVETGAVFDNMYVTAPSCAPSRASLFSGTYPHTNGVFRNDEQWSYCWVKELAEAGYRCVNVGKMHTMPIEGDFGFHERHVVENKDRAHVNLPFYLDNWDKALHTRGVEKPSRRTYVNRADYREALGSFVWEAPEDLHADVFVGQTACWWLERYSGTEPFFLQVGMPGPHPPYDPTQEYLDRYLEKDLPPVVGRDAIDSQPAPLKALRENHLTNDHDAVVHLENPTDEQLHLQRAHYYANVSMIDTQVGEIIKALEARGVMENTIIIFTSDHGDCLNDHGHSQKWSMFEQSVHVPAVVAWPKGIAAGQRFEQLVSLFDLGPTVLEFAGADVPDWMEAKSLVPLMNGAETGNFRDQVFAEHSDDAILTETNFMTMVVEQGWKLVHFVDCPEGQLFDLSNDPTEVENLWDEPNHRALKDALLNKILEWRIESSRKSQGFIRMLAKTQT